jgi:hypothetical protein
VNSRKESAADDGARVLFIDTHVHIYPVFSLDALFDAAVENFARAAGSLGLAAAPRDAMLLLTETVDDHAFEALASGELRPERWQVASTAEPAVLRVSHEKQPPLWLVAGRQIATREDLEVLALGATARFPDGEPFESSIAAADQAAAVTALPWGFGKWWGGRGAIIERVMRTPRARPLYLGDNGGRLALSTRPKLLSRGESFGLKVLPGTDPLPFAGQESRVGAFGMLLRDWDPDGRPLAQFARRLSELPRSPTQFGRLTGLAPFVRLQIAMQMRKRARRGAPS